MPIYMLFDGVPGSVRRKGGLWLPLRSVSLGSKALSVAIGSTSDAARPQEPSECYVTRPVDGSTGALWLTAVKGSDKQGVRVVIEYVNVDRYGVEESPLRVLAFEGAIVTSHSQTCSGAVDRWTEEFTLNFTKLTRPHNAIGAGKAIVSQAPARVRKMPKRAPLHVPFGSLRSRLTRPGVRRGR